MVCGIARTRNGRVGAILALRRAGRRLAVVAQRPCRGKFFPSKNDGLADLLDIFAKYWLNSFRTGAIRRRGARSCRGIPRAAGARIMHSLRWGFSTWNTLRMMAAW